MGKTNVDENTDKYNPSAVAAENLYRQEMPSKSSADAGIDQLESYANDPANASNPNKNIERAEAQEKQGLYRNTAKSTTNSKRNVSGKSSWKNRSKKLIPSALLSVILGGGIGITAFLPVTMPINIMEVFSNDLNDSTSWYERQSLRVYGKKLDGSTEEKKRTCETKGAKACQIVTFGKKAMDKMNKPGSKVTPVVASDGIDGDRVIVSALKVTGTNNTERTIRTSQEMNRMLQNDVGLRSGFYSAFNPKNESFFGQRFGSIVAGFGSSLAKKIKGDTKSEAEESYKQANTNSIEQEQQLRAGSGTDDSDRTDEEKANDKQNTDSAAEKLNAQIESGEKTTGPELGKSGGVLAGAQMFCAVHQGASLVSAGAKALTAKRLAKFALIFLTGAAAIKAGEATNAEVETMMETLAPSEYPEKVEDPETGEMIDNPNIGLNALDSEAYKIVVHGDQGNLNDIAYKFMVGGAATSTVAATLKAINESAGGRQNVRSGCKVANNQALNIGLTILAGPVALALFAGGLAAQPLIENAMAAIINKAIDLAAGADLTTNIQGVDAGNALFAGTATLLGASSMRLGMKPGNKSEILKNVAMNHQVNQSYVAMERYEAKDTPFDASNEYTFLGSLVKNLRGDSNGTSTSGSILGPLSLLGASTRSLTDSASANLSMPVGYDSDTNRFSKCEDDAYAEIQIDADRFCNVRYVPFSEADVNDVFAYMEPYVDTDTGEPLEEDNAFGKYIRFCVERTQGWGEIEDEEEGNYDLNIGKTCREDSLQNVMFANYIALIGVQDDMDTDQTDNQSQSTPTGNGETFNVGTYNILNSDSWSAKSRSLGGCSTGGGIPNDPTCGKTRARMQADIINGKAGGNPQLDIIGTQETSPIQYNELKSILSGYDVFPTDPSGLSAGKDGAVAIFWNKAKFSKIESGKYPALSNTMKPINNPWVGLQTSEGRKIYVTSIHYATDPRGGTPAGLKRSSDLTMNWVRSKLRDDTTVIVTGDFNDRISQGNTYCAFTNNGAMQHAADMSINKKSSCPIQGAPAYNGIDHIFTSTGGEISVSNWKNTGRSGIYSRSSDHGLSYASFEFPGSEKAGDVGPDGWAWPMKGSESKPGPCYGGASVHAGVDMNSDSNSTVFAMKDGQVVRVINGVTGSSPATGNHIMIKTSDNIFYGYQHLQNGSIKVKMGDTVKAGQAIAKMGATGSVNLGSSKTHLHITMARTNTTGRYGDLSTTFDPMTKLKSVKPKNYYCT